MDLHESRSYKALSLVTTMTVGSPGSGQQKHSTRRATALNTARIAGPIATKIASGYK